MKLLFAVSAVLLLLTISALAGETSFGIKAGTALSNQDFDYSIFLVNDFDYRVGLTVGVFAEIPLTSNLAVQPAIQYVPGGMKEKLYKIPYDYPESPAIPFTVRPKIDYISFPVLLKAGLPVGRFVPYAIAGPRMSYEIGAQDDGFNQVYDHLNKMIFGLSLGAGIEMSLNREASLLVEFQYSQDFTNVYDADSAPHDATLESIKNRTISIMTGVRFGSVLAR